eukprot:GHVN01106977.1.p1 GENE.GHVN01106977.1~~GHVN01106977.1.p1  ORF type:complete len:421 (+),score=51.68 GHVN01106977.1:40-1302(+)
MKMIEAPLYCLFVDSTLKVWWSVIRFLFGGAREDVVLEIQALWADWSKAHQSNVITCVSARTCLDLYLQTASLAVGDEVLVSGINIPGVPFILRQHGLIPVPVDVKLESMAINLEEAELSVTTRTRAILVAHLYGSQNDVKSVCEFAAKHKLLVIEDCAEAFCGKQYTGDRQADLSFFSFGLIKTNTAFGGAIGVVKDVGQSHRMKALQRMYSVQSMFQFVNRLLVALFIIVFQSRPIVQLMFRLRRLTNIDYKQSIVPLLRGYKAGGRLQQFRRQPSTPLLRTLLYRLSTWQPDVFEADMQKLNVFTKELENNGVRVPGSAATRRNYWLYPIVAPTNASPVEMCNSLWEVGVDASVQSTQLCAIEPPLTGHYRQLKCVPDFSMRVLYLPVHRRATTAELELMASEVGKYVMSLKPEEAK